jgi:hypothetical protein
MLRHHLVNSKEEYLKWVRKVKYKTYGKDGNDYKLRQELKEFPPLKYPCIIVYMFETDFDRCGDIKTEVCNFVYLAEFTEGFDPYQEENDHEKLEKKLHPYFLALEKLRDIEWEIDNKGVSQELELLKTNITSNIAAFRKRHMVDIDKYMAELKIRVGGY